MLDDRDVGDEMGRETGNVMGIAAATTTTTQQYRSFLNNPMSQGFFSFQPPPTGFDRTSHDQVTAVYETSGMLSEMFDFVAGARPSISAAPAHLLGLVDQHNTQINAGDSAAMHLFLPRSPPPPHQPHNSAIHPLINPGGQGFQPQFTWIPEGGVAAAVEGQGLSLSLASSLEAAKAEELRMRTSGGYGGGHEMMSPLQGYGGGAHHFGFGTTPSSSVFSLAAVNVLRNSRYTRPAQDLLEEFCSVGRAPFNRSITTTTTTTTKLAMGAVNNPTASTSYPTKDLPPLSPADRTEHQRRKVKLVSMLDEVERRYSHYCEQMQMVVNSFDMVMGFGAAFPYTSLAQKAMSRHFRCLKDGIQAQLKHSCELLGEKDMTGGTGITKGETPRLKMLEQSLRKQRAFHQMGMMEHEAWRPQRGLPERSVSILRAWLFEHFLHPYPSDADKHLLARQTGLSRNQVANWFINARVRLWKPMIEEMYQQESKEHEEDVGEENELGEGQAAEAKLERESNSRAQTSTQQPTPRPAATTSQIINARGESDGSLFNIASSSSSLETQLTPNYMRQQPPPPPESTAVGPTTNAQGFIQTTTTAATTTSYSHVDACNHFGTTAPGGVDSSAHHHHHHVNSSAVVGPTMIRFGTTATATSAGDVSLTLGLRHGPGGRNPPEKTGFSFSDFGRAS